MKSMKSARDALDPSRPQVAKATTRSENVKPLKPGPISVFISREEGRLFVRKGFDPVFDVPVKVSASFSVVALAVAAKSGLDPAKTNVNGGAVALGHPIGASGARILVTLLSALEQQNRKMGLATLCIGGGEAVAMVVERA